MWNETDLLKELRYAEQWLKFDQGITLDQLTERIARKFVVPEILYVPKIVYVPERLMGTLAGFVCESEGRDPTGKGAACYQIVYNQERNGRLLLRIIIHELVHIFFGDAKGKTPTQIQAIIRAWSDDPNGYAGADIPFRCATMPTDPRKEARTEFIASRISLRIVQPQELEFNTTYASIF